jgi:hypothetical protein
MCMSKFEEAVLGGWKVEEEGGGMIEEKDFFPVCLFCVLRGLSEEEDMMIRK